MKYSICSDTFPDWELEQIFRYAAGLGYQAVELAPYSFCNSVMEVSQAERNKIRKWAEEAGIEITGLHAIFASIPGIKPRFACPPGLQLNSPDPGTRLKTKEYLKEVVKFCRDVGGKVVVFGSASARNVLEGMSYDDAWQSARGIFRECSELAGQYGVNLCIEPIHASVTNFINTPEEAVKMVEDVGHPNFRWIFDTMLDTWSRKCQGVGIAQAIEKFGDSLAHVHANDDNKSWPGSGGIDFNSIARALKSINYDGYISVEVFDLSPNPETIATEAIKYLRAVFAF